MYSRQKYNIVGSHGFCGSNDFNCSQPRPASRNVKLSSASPWRHIRVLAAPPSDMLCSTFLCTPRRKTSPCFVDSSPAPPR